MIRVGIGRDRAYDTGLGLGLGLGKHAGYLRAILMGVNY